MNGEVTGVFLGVEISDVTQFGIVDARYDRATIEPSPASGRTSAWREVDSETAARWTLEDSLESSRGRYSVLIWRVVLGFGLSLAGAAATAAVSATVTDEM